MKQTPTIRRIAYFSLTALALMAISSCLPLAAGAAAGYVAHDEGYRLRNPVKKVD